MSDDTDIIIPEGMTKSQILDLARAIRKKDKKKYVQQPVLRARRFTDEELCKLYAWIVDNEWSVRYNEHCWRVRLMLGTGMRISEVVRMQIGVNCWKTGYIEVAAEHSKTKRARALRIIPELERHWKAKFEDYPEGEYLVLPIAENDVSSGLPPIATIGLERSWNKVCAAAGIRNLQGAHGARHTFASWEIGLGRLKIEQVAAYLGHRSIEMTYNAYLSILAELDGQPKWPQIAVQGSVRPAFKKSPRRKV